MTKDEIATQNLIAKTARANAFREQHDPLAMKMLRGENDPDGNPITEASLKAVADGIRNAHPYIE